jgi:Pterin-4a-carbinolamine dehydratase
MSLSDERCISCAGGVPPVSGEERRSLQRELSEGWSVIGDHHLEKKVRFPDFNAALAFTNRVGVVAEEQGHHPEILVAWGHVTIRVWTHAIDGLTRSDFVLAAKIDRIPLDS